MIEGRHAIIMSLCQSLCSGCSHYKCRETKRRKWGVNYLKISQNSTYCMLTLSELLLVTCLILLQHHKINIYRTGTDYKISLIVSLNKQMKNDYADSSRNQFCVSFSDSIRGGKSTQLFYLCRSLCLLVKMLTQLRKQNSNLQYYSEIKSIK